MSRYVLRNEVVQQPSPKDIPFIVTLVHLPQQRLQPDSWSVGKGYLSFDYFHSFEEVIGDEQVAVEVCKIYGRGELGGSGYCA